MKKSFISILLSVCMVLTMTPFAFADTPSDEGTATENDKTITVDPKAEVVEGQAYNDIQSAINYLRSLGDEKAGELTDGPEDGWTIDVKAGNYGRFNVINGVDYLTIKSSEGAVINVLDGSEIPEIKITYTKSDGKTATIKSNQTTRINSGVAVNASNLTLDGLTFNMGTTKKSWQASAVEATNGDTAMERANGLSVTGCTFNGNGTGNGVFADNGLTTYTLTKNTFNNLDQGTYMEDYVAVPLSVKVTGNTYNSCAFAYHGSYDNNVNKEPMKGSLVFTGNTVTGTDTLRNKVIIQDSSDHGSTVVDISGNTLTNALIGTVNLDTDNDGVDDLTPDPFTANTYGESSYYVKAHEPGSIDYYSTYQAPEGSVGYWDITGIDETDWTDEQKAAVTAAVDKANAEQSTVLSITGIDSKNLIHTFTWFKNAVYWRSYSSGSLTVSKEVKGKDTDQSFNFKLTLEGKTAHGEDLSNTTQKYGDLTFTNGSAEFSLKNGQRVLVKGLPDGVTYKAEELNVPSDYTMTSKNSEGTVEAGKDQAAEFVNTVEPPYVPPTPPAPTVYTLTYVSNGGTEYDKEKYTAGTKVDIDKTPVRDGYTFTGWYADKDLTTKITEVTMNSDKTVYAGWKENEVPSWLNGDDHFAYVVGYPDGNVKPEANITRGETAAIFFRLLKEDVRAKYLTSESKFKDMSSKEWCNTQVATVANLGVVSGKPGDVFDPDTPITRAEFAAICDRFDQTVTEGSSSFTDISGHWAEKEINRAATLGWIQGYGDGRFVPDGYITRAEAMTMVNRVLCRIPEEESDLLDGMNVWPDNQPSQWHYLAVQEATNTHDCVSKNEVYEKWTKMLKDPDWMQYLY